MALKKQAYMSAYQNVLSKKSTEIQIHLNILCCNHTEMKLPTDVRQSS